MIPTEPTIVFFDGVCHLCQRSVQFILKNDPAGHFRFAPLQGSTARDKLGSDSINPVAASIVLLEKGIRYERSTAALRICKHLRWPAKALYGGMIFPRFLRDAVYRWIAHNRYRWFGKDESCWLPRPEWRDRFLD
jgi:predicted DCC family thiol-disulfide oxidoreductase YuxK